MERDNVRGLDERFCDGPKIAGFKVVAAISPKEGYDLCGSFEAATSKVGETRPLANRVMLQSRAFSP